ncbi:MAG: pitrilysin family protein [Isosphaeraceae bacterium]
MGPGGPGGPGDGPGHPGPLGPLVGPPGRAPGGDGRRFPSGHGPGRSVPAGGTFDGRLVPARRLGRPGRGRRTAQDAGPPALARGHLERPNPGSLGPARRASKLDAYRPRRQVLPNGMRLLWEQRPGTGTLALELHVEAGQLREAKPGLAHLVGRLREEGAGGRSATELAQAVEDLGGSLDVGATGPSLRVRSEDLPLAVEILADLMLRPRFPGDAVGWSKRRMAAELQADRDEPSFRADQAFRALVYGDNPYGRDPRGNVRQIAALTLEDVLAHDRMFSRPNNAILAVAGDFNPQELRQLVKQAFGGWEPARVDLPKPPPLARGLRPRTRRHSAAGEQVQILLGHLGIRREDPDFDALCVLDPILGSGPGFTDRLSRVLRDELGLAYTVSAGLAESSDIEPGLLRIYAGTGPEEAPLAVAAMLEQVRAIHEGKFSDEEVREAQEYLAGAWVFDYQSVGQRAERLLELERLGLPLDEPIRWPERILRIRPREVRQAARRQISPEALIRLEYGPIVGRKDRADRDCA